MKAEIVQNGACGTWNDDSEQDSVKVIQKLINDS